MTLVVKVGNNQDLAPKPKNWPSCGSFSFERSDHNVVESNQAERNLSYISKDTNFFKKLLSFIIFIYQLNF